MEVKLKDLILTVDSFLTSEQVGAIIRTYKKRKFSPTHVAGKDGSRVVDTNTRNVTEFSIVRNEKSMTDIHWCNFLIAKIKNLSQMYCNRNGVYERPEIIETIDMLRYEKGGYYTKHIDDGPDTPRTLSIIIFLNNDYKGGNIEFNFLNSSLKIEPGPGKAIIWPSNFLFPHAALKVEEGIRYALVSWLR
jgi:hypothetical protein